MKATIMKTKAINIKIRITTHKTLPILPQVIPFKKLMTINIMNKTKQTQIRIKVKI